ncbi:Uncharacterised protein [Mycobacterium tuberculosis]|nr:Uncharacterised protein [Mycobacterium tuberculosis]
MAAVIACSSVKPGGSVTARLASQVRNVRQQPPSEKPPTRSPTW